MKKDIKTTLESFLKIFRAHSDKKDAPQKRPLRTLAEFIVKIPQVLNAALSACVRLIKKIPGFVRSFPSLAISAFKAFPGKIRHISVSLKDEYIYWLYHGERRKKSEGKGRILPITFSLLLIAFALYYMGVYDIAFVERPDGWKDNAENLFEIWYPAETHEPPVENTPPEKNETANKTPTVSSVDINGTLDVIESDKKIDYTTEFKTSDELVQEGYYITDGFYDENYCEVGIMSFDFDFPENFSYRKMLKRDFVITNYDDGRMSTVEDTEVEVERPALYTYMGYIIYDDCGRRLYLLDSVGNVLMEYNDNYIPAFARDTSGNPLFYSTYSYLADVPVATEENEAGEDVVVQTKSVYLNGRNYFSLSGTGNYFVANDYVEERDGRGLNFDFPSSYGMTDSRIKRVGLISPKLSTFLDGTNRLVNFANSN